MCIDVVAHALQPLAGQPAGWRVGWETWTPSNMEFGRQLYRGKNVKQEVLLIPGQVHRSRAMQNTSDNADRGLESAGKHPLDGTTPRPLGSRAAAAGSEFLKALGSDLAGVAVRPVEFLTVIRHRLAEASKPAIAAMSAFAARLVEFLTVLRQRLAEASKPAIAAMSALAARLVEFLTVLRQRLAEASKPAIAAMSALVVQLGQFQTVKREPREPPAALVVPAMSARGMLLRRLGLGIALTALSGTLTLSCWGGYRRLPRRTHGWLGSSPPTTRASAAIRPMPRICIGRWHQPMIWTRSWPGGRSARSRAT